MARLEEQEHAFKQRAEALARAEALVCDEHAGSVVDLILERDELVAARALLAELLNAAVAERNDLRARLDDAMERIEELESAFIQACELWEV